MNKSNIIIAILLLIIAAGGYKFIIQGNVVKSSDERVAVGLERGERNFILGEMRALLSKVQQLITHLSNNDMDKFAQLAKVLSEDSSGDTQQALIRKMPIAFKQMSYKIHSDFKQLYNDAVEKRDRDYSLKQVSNVMLNCVACHSTFTLKEIEAKK